QRVHVFGRGDDDGIHFGSAVAELLQHFEPAHVGQIDVENEQVRLEAFHDLESLATGVGHADDFKAWHAFGVRAVHCCHEEIVVDDDSMDAIHSATISIGRPASGATVSWRGK